MMWREFFPAVASGARTRGGHPPVAEPDYAAVARSARRSILAFYVASIPFWVLVGFAIGWAAR